MHITVDSNVLFAALYNPNGASAFVLRLIVAERVTLALTVPIFLEYQDLLSRESIQQKLNLTQADVDATLRFIAAFATHFDVSFLWRPNLRDEADNMFIECAVRSQSHYLITSNQRDFTRNAQLRFDDVQVVTPRRFVELWRKEHE